MNHIHELSIISSLVTVAAAAAAAAAAEFLSLHAEAELRHCFEQLMVGCARSTWLIVGRN